jgi:electron transfer flavoprotein beta subunit
VGERALKRIVVCMKPVPDPKAWDRLRMDPETKTLIREGIPSVINPLDKHALEAALEVKDASGAEVVVVSMAPPFGASLLKEALAMGADRAILVSDRAFAGSDTLATARILAAAIHKTGGADLVLCGNASLDGSTAQVPSQLAELLDMPNVMHVCQASLRNGGCIHVTQRIEMGMVRMEAQTPVLLSFTKEVNKPRFISFLGILEAEKKETLVWSNEDLGLDASQVGLSGSPTRMADMLVRESRRKGERLQGDPKEVACQIVDRLYQMGIL